MLQKFTPDDVANIATEVYTLIRLYPTPVQIAVLMGVLSTLIKHSMECRSPLPPGVVALVPLLDEETVYAIQAFELVGVNIGEKH